MSYMTPDETLVFKRKQKWPLPAIGIVLMALLAGLVFYGYRSGAFIADSQATGDGVTEEAGTSAQIIHLVVAGNGEFRMSPESLNGVKAVCIDSRGNSALTVNLGQNVDILEYRGVGNGQAFIKLADKEKSRVISGSLTGNHKLTMDAGSEVCAIADFDLKGHSAMTCR